MQARKLHPLNQGDGPIPEKSTNGRCSGGRLAEYRGSFGLPQFPLQKGSDLFAGRDEPGQ